MGVSYQTWILQDYIKKKVSERTFFKMKLYLLFALLIASCLARRKPPSPPSPDDSSDDSSDTSSCNGDSCDLCGTMTSYSEEISGDSRVITGNGCPPHYSICTGKGVVDGCGDVSEEGSMTEATEQCFEYTIPAYPVLRTDTYSVACEMGAIGVALNGVAFYSGAVDTDCTILDVDDDTAEWTSFDMCGGHSQQGGEYHYHFPPSCLIEEAETRSPTGTGHSPQIGWAFDGFPVYGPLYTGGVDASEYTDDCGGIEEYLSGVDDFAYRYYVTGPTSDLYSLPHDTPTTDQFPYTFDCYAGYTYDELSSGSTGDDGYTSDYSPAATEGYTTSFASYGESGNYVSSYLSGGVCSA